MTLNQPDTVRALTGKWTGERFPDGRPRVSDALLERLSGITLEEAYMPMFGMGYTQQFEGDLIAVKPGKRLVGRAVTAVMVPSRPDVHMALLKQGREREGRNGFFNQWVIETMTSGDVLVVDMCDQILYGTYVGGNLSTAIHARSKTGGAVIWGGIRDLEQVSQIPDLQIYYRGQHPTPIGNVMMTSMNAPTRIGRAVCLPGDVVLGTMSGVVFIPPHLAETIAANAEKAHIRDVFSFIRMREGVYTPAQIDAGTWSPAMMEDFMGWFATADEARRYQYLDWTRELERSREPDTGRHSFDGLVHQSFS